MEVKYLNCQGKDCPVEKDLLLKKDIVKLFMLCNSLLWL